jgi:predicted nucleotidyltransferase
MIQLVENNIEQIRFICIEHSVAALYLFGSALTNEFDEESDLDFAVTFKNDLSPIEQGDAYFGLLDELEKLFKIKIDLISYSVVKNPVFKEELDKTKMTLYAAA